MKLRGRNAYPRARAMLLVAATTVGAVFLPRPAAAAELSVPATVAAVTADTHEAPTTLSAAWKPATSGSPADWYVLQVFSGDLFVGQSVCYGVACTSHHVAGLEPGRVYKALVYAGNAAGFGSGRWSAPVTIRSGCVDPNGMCATIDATRSAGAATGNAQGFLHSAVTPLRAPDAAALAPKWWRVWARPGYYDEFDNARRAGAQVIVVVSDAWIAETSSNGQPSVPWLDWTRYREWVRAYATRMIADGRRPAYWDIQNEPGQPGALGSADVSAWTPDKVLEQFRIAYEEIKAADPAARIMGPSTAQYAGAPPLVGNKLDLRTFLDFAAAHQMKIDAVAWHETNPLALTFDSTGLPIQIVDHVAEVRRLIAARRVGHPAIFISEHGTPQDHIVPGWAVGSLAAFETAKVDGAVMSCWQLDGQEECQTPSLGGIFSPDGVTRRGTYWVHRRYAEMTGKLVAATSSTARLSALATIGTNGVIKTLVGRHEQCTATVPVGCPMLPPYYGAPLTSPAPAGVTLDVRVPARTAFYRIVVERIPADGGPLDAPIVASNSTARVVGGRVALSLPQVADGEAYSITLTPTA